jgi:hypothetical protein
MTNCKVYNRAQDYLNPVVRIYCIGYQSDQSDIWPISQDELLRGHSSLMMFAVSVLRVCYVLKSVLVQEMKQMKNWLWICANSRVQLSKYSSCMYVCSISETNAGILTALCTGGSTSGFLSNISSVGFDVLTAVAMKGSIFSDIITYSHMFRRNIFSPYSGSKLSKKSAWNRQEIFEPDDEGDFRQATWPLYLRKQNYPL